MILFENMQLALEGLLSNKMRAILTILGIIIGIGSVIGIVTVGDAMSASVAKGMQGAGATNINVMLTGRDSEDWISAFGDKIAEKDLITDEMIEKYIERYGGNVEAISLSSIGSPGRAQDGRRYANVTMVGVNAGFANASSLKMASGRFLNDADKIARRSVAVVSDRLADNLFPRGESALGRELKVAIGDNVATFMVAGVYKNAPRGDSMMARAGASKYDMRTELYIPISTFNVMEKKANGYSGITVMAAASADAKDLASKTGKFFAKFYEGNKRFTVEAESMGALLEDFSSMMNSVSVAVAIIAGISLLVGGIGVMNIMLVSVTERTREIGTRKAIGARNSAIRVQFIVESVIICLIGGAIGIILGYAIGAVGSRALGYKASPSLHVIAGSVLFSMAIGVFFGYYPAKKASDLDPI
ncbi:MAG: ABC transporter permease, partial [Clostridiales bacterium]|nr:ABC transporter permease [Clostridiales bacterium]